MSDKGITYNRIVRSPFDYAGPVAAEFSMADLHYGVKPVDDTNGVVVPLGPRLATRARTDMWDIEFARNSPGLFEVSACILFADELQECQKAALKRGSSQGIPYIELGKARAFLSIALQDLRFGRKTLSDFPCQSRMILSGAEIDAACRGKQGEPELIKELFSRRPAVDRRLSALRKRNLG